MGGGEISDLDDAAVLGALAWLVDSGIEVLVEDNPRNWLAKPRAAPVALASDTAPAPATLDFSAHMTIEALHAAIVEDNGALLGAGGRALLFASGNPTSGLMLLGDAADAHDERESQLFAGDAGRLLDRMLAAIGRDRASAYFANVACFRPMDGRLPQGEAGTACLALVRRHIALAAPKLLLILGDGATRALTGETLGKARGRVHRIDLGGAEVSAVTTFHPRQLLDQPGLKPRAWDDLQLAMEHITA